MVLRNGKDRQGSCDGSVGEHSGENQNTAGAEMVNEAMGSSSYAANNPQPLNYEPQGGSTRFLGSVSSERSSNSSIKSTRRLQLEAELRAKEALANIEKDLILKRLELEKAAIEEENENQNDEASSRSSPSERFSVDSSLSEKHDTVATWMEKNNEQQSNDAILKLADVLKDALSKGCSHGNTKNNSNMEKIICRQYAAKQLPIFTGISEEWPSFINSYRSSTEICGFTPHENMMRLQQCLREKAREAVLSMLFLPDRVNDVIDVLEKSFGRPDNIVKGMILKAKQMSMIREDRLECLSDFSNLVRNLVATFESVDRRGHLFNPQLLEELLVKLPYSLRLRWGHHVLTLQQDVPTIKDFSRWLMVEADAISHIGSRSLPDSFNKQHEKKSESKWPSIHSDGKLSKPIQNVLATDDRRRPKLNCGFCDKDGHDFTLCYGFKRATLPDRLKWATANKTCFSCLRSGHYGSQCPRKTKCTVYGCGKSHHFLLHSNENNAESHTVAHSSSFCNQILLRVAPVCLKGPQGEVNTYALFDEASTCTLLDSKVAMELGLDGQIDPLRLRWTDASTQYENDSQRVSLSIRGKSNEVFHMDNVRTVKKLDLPTQSVDVSKMKAKWTHLESVDVQPLDGAQPTILIGQDNWDLIIARSIIEGPKNAPVLSQTKLGWVIHGNVSMGMPILTEQVNFLGWADNRDRDEELHSLVKDSFKTESFGVKLPTKSMLSKNSEEAQRLLESTTRRVGDRWETGLLWKSSVMQLPHSKDMALRRLKTVEKSLAKDPLFAAAYKSKIQEYLEKGYAKKLSPVEVTSCPKEWYLPHFGVYNPNKPGKMRFVFDGAAKSYGVSLNDNLHSGPDLLKPLLSVLFKFRQRIIGFTGDIREMFHRVLIRAEDLPSQRFLWRDLDPTRDPDVYEMRVMTFGSTSSPCSAQYVKNKNAEEFRDEFPAAAEAIVSRHYVDDYLDSSHSIHEANKLIAEVIDLHARGGFEIRNWSCSSKDVLLNIPSELRASELDISLNEDSLLPNERILGLKWNPNADDFFFTLNLHKVSDEVKTGKKTPTKREVLKLVMSLYDPLGFLSNFTVAGKIIIQDVWRSGIGWDDELSHSVHEKWKLWISRLEDVTRVRVPRCYSNHMKDRTHVELHIFCDASEKAFAAVSYLRVLSRETTSVSLVMARCRVAPLRPISIPRLELQAAVMGARLSQTIIEEHDIEVNKKYFWTDSKTVLCWLRSDARNYKQFVGHRIGEICEVSDVSEWRWVPTKENPADDATRENSSELSPCTRWIRGPSFLLKPCMQWPIESGPCTVPAENLELKSDVVLATFVTSSLPDPNRYSCWLKLIRTTAWMLRFFNKLKLKSTRQPCFWPKELTSQELEEAELKWWRVVQNEVYTAEVACLSAGERIKSVSTLYTLCPWLDPNGIMRVDGRIPAITSINDMTRSPVILPSKHPYTRLLINFYHVGAKHNGMEYVVNELRQRFWISSLRVAVRSVWNRCQFCKNRRSKPVVPKMADLPSCRLQIGQRPFTATGMDFFGPLEVTIGRKRVKHYGVIFTCLTTRAIHLELAASLSTDSCIMSIRRMIGRRGQPSTIYSDNGTNLRGAEKELREAISSFNQDQFFLELSPLGITWKFNPPGAPHMGGSWERLIRSVKTALRVTLKERAPKIEVMTTLLVEAEFVINSRPLTYVSLDHKDDEALTPNHFLLGSSAGHSLPGSFSDKEIRSKKQWKCAQRLADQFWKRWTKEYLPDLTRRVKWFHAVSPLAVGAVVLIVDPTLSRNNWPRGIVEKTYPGRNGQVRVADVRTIAGIVKRPVTKICVLDVKSDGDECLDSAPEGRM